MQDLINQVLKTDKKELNKTQLYTLQEVIGFPESVKRFLKSNLPFDFGIPYTKDKINEVAIIIKSIRKDISLLIPPEKLQAHFNPTSTNQSLPSTREDLIHFYVTKAIENHVLMMSGGKVSKDNQVLFETVANQIHQNVLDDKGGANIFFQLRREYEKKLMDSLLSPTSNMEDFIKNQAVASKNQSDSPTYRLGLEASAEILADKLKGIMGEKHPEMVEYFTHPKQVKKNRANFTGDAERFFDLIVKSFAQDPLARYLQDLDFQKVSPHKTFSEMDSDLFELNLGDNAEKMLRKNKNLGKIQQPYTQEMVEIIHEMITGLREDIKNNQDILDVIDEKSQHLTLDEKVTLIFYIMRSYCYQFFSLCVKGQPYASDIKDLYLSVEMSFDKIDNPKKIYKKIMEEKADRLADQFFEFAHINGTSSVEKNAGFLLHAITISSESSYFNYVEKSIIEKLVRLDQKTQINFFEACKEIQDSGLLEQLNEKGRALHKKILNALDEKSDSEMFMFSPRSPRFSPRKEDLKGSNQFINRSSSSSSSFSSSSSSMSPRTPTKLPRTVNFSDEVDLIPKISKASEPPKTYRPLPEDDLELPELAEEESSEGTGGRFWKKN